MHDSSFNMHESSFNMHEDACSIGVMVPLVIGQHALIIIQHAESLSMLSINIDDQYFASQLLTLLTIWNTDFHIFRFRGLFGTNVLIASKTEIFCDWVVDDVDRQERWCWHQDVNTIIAIDDVTAPNHCIPRFGLKPGVNVILRLEHEITLRITWWRTMRDVASCDAMTSIC